MSDSGVQLQPLLYSPSWEPPGTKLLLLNFAKRYTCWSMVKVTVCGYNNKNRHNILLAIAGLFPGKKNHGRDNLRPKAINKGNKSAANVDCDMTVFLFALGYMQGAWHKWVADLLIPACGKWMLRQKGEHQRDSSYHLPITCCSKVVDEAIFYYCRWFADTENQDKGGRIKVLNLTPTDLTSILDGANCRFLHWLKQPYYTNFCQTFSMQGDTKLSAADVTRSMGHCPEVEYLAQEVYQPTAAHVSLGTTLVGDELHPAVQLGLADKTAVTACLSSCATASTSTASMASRHL